MKNCDNFGFSACEIFVKTLKDKGNPKIKLEINCNEKLKILRVDDCIITDKKTKKCDFLILKCDSNIASFIELKGSNLDDAFEQILSTYNYLKLKIDKFANKEAIIVLRKQNMKDLNSTSYRKLAKVFLPKNIKKNNNSYIYR